MCVLFLFKEVRQKECLLDFFTWKESWVNFEALFFFLLFSDRLIEKLRHWLDDRNIFHLPFQFPFSFCSRSVSREMI